MSIFFKKSIIPLYGVLILASACSIAQTSSSDKASEVTGNFAHTESMNSACQSSTKYFRNLINSNNLSEQEKSVRSELSALESYAWVDNSTGVKEELESSPTNLVFTKSIEAAAMANSVAALKVLLDSKTHLQEANLNAGLLTSAQCGNILAVKSLVASGARPNATNEEGLDAVMVSLVSHHFDVTQTLLSAGYDSCAIKTKDGKSIKLLAESVGALEISQGLPDCN